MNITKLCNAILAIDLRLKDGNTTEIDKAVLFTTADTLLSKLRCHANDVIQEKQKHGESPVSVLYLSEKITDAQSYFEAMTG